MTKPDRIRIIPDEYHFPYVGRCADGTQFLAFVSGAFPRYEYPPARALNNKLWLAITHVFDKDGTHLRTDVKVGGPDTEGRTAAGEKAWNALDVMLGSLKAKRPVICEINVKPFSVIIDDITHGLIYEAPEAEDDDGWVMLQPRDIMFHPPWDSGEYST